MDAVFCSDRFTIAVRFRPDALNTEFRDELAVAIVRSWGVLKISAEAAGNQRRFRAGE